MKTLNASDIWLLCLQRHHICGILLTARALCRIVVTTENNSITYKNGLFIFQGKRLFAMSHQKIDQKEYLKKYLSGGSSHIKKKKKKKEKSASNVR